MINHDRQIRGVFDKLRSTVFVKGGGGPLQLVLPLPLMLVLPLKTSDQPRSLKKRTKIKICDQPGSSRGDGFSQIGFA